MANLIAWQTCDWVHPYTCASEHPEGRSLTPGPDGFVCVTCGYRQNWCWAPMLGGPPPNPIEALLRGDYL